MPIGYKCMTTRDITRIVVDMLRASIEQTPAPAVNSYDLVKKFQEQDEDPTSDTRLTPKDRNFINSRYHRECGPNSEHVASRRTQVDEARLSADNERYYKDKLWPLGIVIYGIDKNLQRDPSNLGKLQLLQQAMTTLEVSTCVVFQQVTDTGAGAGLRARSVLWFTEEGADSPQLGFVIGNQSISLSDMVAGAAGHQAHALNQLVRALGLHMESNSYDRDYYITVNWNNVIKGKEHYIEKAPRSARVLPSLGYDFHSATHAPANYMCGDCRRGEVTVQPTQEQLWQRTLSMGRRAALSRADRARLAALYRAVCQDRYRARDTSH